MLKEVGGEIWPGTPMWSKVQEIKKNVSKSTNLGQNGWAM